MDQVKIGKYISSKRKALELTQEQLAEKLGKSGKAVSKWERGVCLPDVAVYTDLCSILGITLNEFFAGEDIEMADVAEQSEKNLLGVAEEGKTRRGRLKKIIILVTVVALILATLLGGMLIKGGYFQNKYVKPLDKSSSEYRTATELIVPDLASMFDYSVDDKFGSMTISVYELDGGKMVGEPTRMSDEFAEDESIASRKGIVSFINDYDNSKLKLIISSEYGSVVSREMTLGKSIKNFDEYGLTLDETEPIKNIEPDKEYPLVAYYYFEDEACGVSVEEAWEQYADNPSGSDHTFIITVKFTAK